MFLPTPHILASLGPPPSPIPAQIEVELSRAQVEHIKYKAKGELQPDGTREVGGGLGGRAARWMGGRLAG